ncbi:ABC transporter permease [Lysobacter sp. N42]|uniref:ABC transporter permease n=2 Tax=Gammaproteobacteria TaxID=1236 RepID=UPI001A9DDB72|nr:FtsX-like permease family protein [Lysobacter sp. N42]
MAIAIAFSVASVLSLSVFSERLQAGILAQSSEFLAADRVLRSRQEIPIRWIEQAREQGLQSARRTTFNSMVFASNELALADIKAVSEEYPLRGTLEIAEQPFAQGNATESLPVPGEAWVHSGLFQQLPIELGDSIEVGNTSFVVTKVLIKEPDSGFSVFADAPTVLIPYSDLAATGLIQPGSRVSFNYLFAGEPEDIDTYEQWIIPQLDDLTQSWRGIRDGDSPLASALNRAERFMLLASLLGVVLAATAVAVAAQRYCQRNYDAVAIMKTLGGNNGFVRSIFVTHLLLLSLFSIFIGSVLGYFIQLGVGHWVAKQLAYSLPAASWKPWGLAISTGLLSALLFSLYPLLRLLSIPPLRVLRRELDGDNVKRVIHWFACGGGILLLMVLYSRNLTLSLALFAGGAFAAMVLLLIGRLLIRLSRQAGMQAGSSWRLAMAGMQRRAKENSLQMLSFATAIMLLLLVLALRTELLDDWQNQLPENAPNFFVVNVAPEQVSDMQTMFTAENIQATDLYPITPGRLVSINGQLVRDEVSKEDRDNSDVREGFGRELQLTWRSTLPPENNLISGRWFEGEELGVSVESEVAERLALKLGDILEFRVGGAEFEVPVLSIREVDWNTMQPNFYMIFNENTISQNSATYIASFYLPSERKAELYDLFKSFPQASLIDVDDIIQQIRGVIGHVSMAITFVMVLVMFAGGLVLLAQVQASLEEREQEIVILRTLGARSKLLTQAVSYEFIILGALAGFIAAVAMEASIYILQTQVFEMAPTIHWRFWLLGPVVGASVVTLLGWFSCRSLLRQRTGTLIRALA